MGKTKLLSTAAMLFLIMTAGCQKSVSNPDPEISLASAESTATSIGFTATTANATTAAYVIMESEQEIPDAETILEQGVKIAVGKTVNETVSGLETATEYTIAAVASNDNGTLSKIATLTVSTESDLYSDIKSEYSDLWWYGSRLSKGTDRFCLQLSTAEVDDYLIPSEGGEYVRIYLYTAPIDPNGEIYLAPGTYTMGNSNEFTHMTFDPDKSYYSTGTTANDWTNKTFESGEVIVEYDGSQYSITVNMVLDDGKQSKVRARHTGTLKITDCLYGFIQITSDMNETMVTMTGNITSSSIAPELDVFEILVHNCKLDNDGFIIGRGYVFNCRIYAQKASTYPEYDFSGTYYPNPEWEDDILKAYTFTPGYPYDYGMIFPMGTYLAEYSDAGQVTAVGFVKEGEITMSRDNGKCKIEATVVTDKGANIKVVYDGPDVPLADYRSDNTSQIPTLFGQHRIPLR